jgi:hypothetical protein
MIINQIDIYIHLYIIYIYHDSYSDPAGLTSWKAWVLEKVPPWIKQRMRISLGISGEYLILMKWIFSGNSYMYICIYIYWWCHRNSYIIYSHIFSLKIYKIPMIATLCFSSSRVNAPSAHSRGRKTPGTKKSWYQPGIPCGPRLGPELYQLYHSFKQCPRKYSN